MSYFYDPELDRKSSRGMIFENEELRLRTININAEVERGQTDIKRLRRENEHLRREIWTLRDECDRLNKRFKAKLFEHDHGNCNARGSGGSSGCTRCPSHSDSDDSDSCDMCRCEEEQCSDENCCQCSSKQSYDKEESRAITNGKQAQQQGSTAMNGATAMQTSNTNTHPSATFDHLSVVSEETLSNSEVQGLQSESLIPNTPSLNDSQSTLPSLLGPLTPLTPIELVANQMNDLQATVPPLSYFENILHDHMNVSPELPAITPKVIKHTNGWDYNLDSPFSQRKHGNRHPPNTASGLLRSPSTKQRQEAIKEQQHQTLTTFLPTPTPSTPTTTTDASPSSSLSDKTLTPPQASSYKRNVPSIETVAITTNNTPQHIITNSPKHFFAPLKPRLKINTSLANKNAPVPVPPVVPPQIISPTGTTTSITTAMEITPVTTTSTDHTATTMTTTHPTTSIVASTPVTERNCDPPDIFVANALASPYQRQPHSSPLSQASTRAAVPSQVSPRHHNTQEQNHKHHIHIHHHHHHQLHHVMHHQVHNENLLLQRHHQQNNQDQLECDRTVGSAFIRTDDGAKDMLHDGSDGAITEIYATPINTKHLVSLPLTLQKVTTNKTTSTTPKRPTTENDRSEQSQHSVVALVSKNSVSSAVAAAEVETTEMTALNQVLLPIQKPKAFFNKSNEPVYATAEKRCTNFLPAPAYTQPLMAVTANTTALHTAVAHVRLLNTTTTRIVLTAESEVQTESVNLETILNDIEAISEDILAIQLRKNQGTDQKTANGSEGTNIAQKALAADDKNKKPYRSEMNLVLSYESGANPTITPVSGNKKGSNAAASNGNLNSSVLKNRTRSLERNSSESPPTSVPQPMQPFPSNRTYLGFDKLNDASIKANHVQRQPPPPPPSQVVATISRPGTPLRPPPPLPPTRACPPPPLVLPNSIKTTASPTHNGTVARSIVPNKSHLYTALANAAAKRAQFRMASPELSKSFEEGFSTTNTGISSQRLGTPTIEIGQHEFNSSKQTPPANKSRSVSILDSPSIPDPNSKSSPNLLAETPNDNQLPLATPAPMHLSTGSCFNLSSTPSNPVLQSIMEQSSYSTPNSPHSARRHSETTDNNTLTLPSNNTFVGNNKGHQCLSKASSCRRPSQDSARGVSVEDSSGNIVSPRTRCSRRHSEGTLNSTSKRFSGGSSHHHHHRHHHQHSGSMISNSHPHHSHHSHQDSNQETGSVSDHNSNSLASSRESSTTFSVRSSQRRKISVSSHTGGKIPWCGCWGNGCL